MFIGKVKWFNDRKGFGFILRDNAPDVFVHYSAIQSDGYRTLKPDQAVRYRLIQTDRGPSAVDVELVEVEAPRRTRQTTTEQRV